MNNNYYWSLEDPVMDSIAHHGILGQKWGIRRLIKLDEASSKLNDFTNKDLFKWRKKNV